ncbi:MAG: prolyl-tRNA synthetase associated domain-containing protein [Rikenellaceae bacterium]
MERRDVVFEFLKSHNIDYSWYEHAPAPTIEDARKVWHQDGSKHCKNIFLRNHKGNRHYLVIFDCEHSLVIRDLEQLLKQGKLSFASQPRMEKYLALLPGSVSPFGLINDSENHVHLFIDETLQHQSSLSFHPNDSSATVVIEQGEFRRYLEVMGNSYEYLKLY